MNRVGRGMVVGAVLLVLGVVFRPSAAVEDKEPSIKAIMTKAHKGGKSLLFAVGKDLKEDEPAWADVQSKSKELVKLGMSLGKAKPPKGEKESWEKLTKMYLANAKLLQTAAAKKNKEGALAAQMKLATSCRACHTVHRPKPKPKPKD